MRADDDLHPLYGLPLVATANPKHKTHIVKGRPNFDASTDSRRLSVPTFCGLNISLAERGEHRGRRICRTCEGKLLRLPTKWRILSARRYD